MEASTLQAPAALTRTRVAVGTPLLRFRSDEQLLALFRAGHDEAFCAIHDRYHKRLFAYARQMLPAPQDAEDALQDVFVRAYSGLRASDRELALRAWLFRVAHNRCIDELRRPAPPPPEILQLVRCTVYDPLAEVDLRDSLRRLIADVRRLPDQQRSALLMRELGGVPYVDVAASLGISVGAVKSLLVRARVALAQAADARDTACSEIREGLVGAHDRGVRPNATARRHMRDCVGCRSFRRELRGVTRQLAALAPTVGPLGFVAKLLGVSGGAGGGATASGATASGATAGGGAAIASGGGAAASAGGLVLGANHVATLIAAAAATAGGAVEIQHAISAPSRHPAHVRAAPARSERVSPLAQQLDRAAAATIDPIATAAAAAASVAIPEAHAGTTNGTLKRQLRNPAASSAGGGAGIGPAAGTQAASSSSPTTRTGLATAPGLGEVTGSSTAASTTTDGSTGSPSCPSGGTASGTSPGSTQPSIGSTSGSTSSSSSPSGSQPSGTGTSGSGGTSSTSTSTSSESGSTSSSCPSSSSSSSGTYPTPPQ